MSSLGKLSLTWKMGEPVLQFSGFVLVSQLLLVSTAHWAFAKEKEEEKECLGI